LKVASQGNAHVGTAAGIHPKEMDKHQLPAVELPEGHVQ
jgi:hypothetical protein